MLRSLPLKHGGLGVARHSWVAGQVGALKAYDNLVTFAETYLPDELQDAVREGEEKIVLGANNPLKFVTRSDFALEFPESQTTEEERSLAEQAQAHYAHAASLTHAMLVERDDTARAALFLSQGYEGSGRWLANAHKTNQPARYQFTDAQFKTATRLRMLIAPFEDTPPRRWCSPLRL